MYAFICNYDIYDKIYYYVSLDFYLHINICMHLFLRILYFLVKLF